jgi:hypothetical protein
MWRERASCCICSLACLVTMSLCSEDLYDHLLQGKAVETCLVTGLNLLGCRALHIGHWSSFESSNVVCKMPSMRAFSASSMLACMRT